MKLVDPAAAVRAIPDGATAIFPGGCAEPTRFYRAFSAEVERFSRLTVCAGFSFGKYAYLARGLGTNFRFVTWQASAQLRDLMRENDPRKIGFVPLRLSELTNVVHRDGPIKPEVVVVQTSLPQSDGTVSLGISVGAYQDFIASSKLVIAEMNHHMPVTGGASRVPLDRIAYAFESDEPLCTYATPPAKERDHAIVGHVLNLVPDEACVQLGIGAVPDRVLAQLAGKRGVRLFSGLLTQPVQTFLEAAPRSGEVIAGELAGDQAFYDFCGREQRIVMAPTTVTHNVLEIAKIDRFVSINSALEIDLQGQSNGETIGPLQISGVGGSMDYVDAAAFSRGGISIIALPSTTDDGKRSKIVASLAPGAVVTTPRFCTDYVITEYGVARLKGKDLHARAEALIGIAHPNFRDELAAGFGKAPK
jgi:4-hydroxybutyrate CoA-transferase